MTARQTGDDRPDRAPDTTAADTPAPDTARAAKGSVQEAIGKLIGDDAARARGTAEKRAAGTPSPKASPPR